MAAWQADLHVVLPPEGLPPDYRLGLAEFLPKGTSWDPRTETWGTEAGDRVDVSNYDAEPPEVFVRFDLREWKPRLYEQFVAFVRKINGRLRSAEDDLEVDTSVEALVQNLSASRAARFVNDPKAYLRSLKDQPIQVPEEP